MKFAISNDTKEEKRGSNGVAGDTVAIALAESENAFFFKSKGWEGGLMKRCAAAGHGERELDSENGEDVLVLEEALEALEVLEALEALEALEVLEHWKKEGRK